MEPVLSPGEEGGTVGASQNISAFRIAASYSRGNPLVLR